MANLKDLKYYASISTDYYKLIIREVEKIKNKENKTLFSSKTIEMLTKETPKNVTHIGEYRGKKTPENVIPLYQKEGEEGEELEIG